MPKRIAESELIINPDGSIYHLNLQPHQIAHSIIVVGDPERVPKITQYFDKIDYSVHKREFFTQTGTYNGKSISVVSTGIGTDNIDIVFNELDALVNIDFDTRMVKEQLISLEIVRIGTSGSVQANIPVDSFVASTHGLGMDGLGGFYPHSISENDQKILTLFSDELAKDALGVTPYLADCNPELLQKLGFDFHKGITITNTGFYGPQGRMLRLQPKSTDFIDRLAQLNLDGNIVSNLEMETAAIYLLANLLGHKALSLNAILANRQTGQFSGDPKKAVDNLIKTVLKRWTA